MKRLSLALMFVLGFLISAIVVPTVLAQPQNLLHVWSRTVEGTSSLEKFCDPDSKAAIYVGLVGISSTRNIAVAVLAEGCKK
jgi:hypothetical protein